MTANISIWLQDGILSSGMKDPASSLQVFQNFPKILHFFMPAGSEFHKCALYYEKDLIPKSGCSHFESIVLDQFIIISQRIWIED